MEPAKRLSLLALLATSACAAAPLPPAPCPAPPETKIACSAAPAPAAPLTRDATLQGRRLRYHLALAPQPNLVYQLDCVTGVALCAQPVFRDLWAAEHLDTDAAEALATWKSIRARHGGEVRRIDGTAPSLPLLAPSGNGDLAERQRIAGLRASTPDAYESSIALLTSDADARALRAVVERFSPRFDAWWEKEAFAAGSAYLDGFSRLLADPFFDATVDAAARFYEADVPPGTEIRIALLVQPRSARDFSVAYQLEGDAVVEVPPGRPPESQIDVVAHELFHYFFFLQRPERRAAMLDRVCRSPDPYAAASFGMLDEAVAAALGNGVIGRHYLAPDAFAAQLRKGFVNYGAAGAVARALFPALDKLLASGATVSSDDFAAAYEAAARASYPGGRPRAIDYLHSEISTAPAALAAASQHLHDVAWAGFPYLREHPLDDPAAASDLAAHPFESAAIFLTPDASLATRLATLGAPSKHAAAVAARARTSPGFVYAFARSPKSYAFVFVAKDDAAGSSVVDRFAALSAPPREGVEVDLTEKTPGTTNER